MPYHISIVIPLGPKGLTFSRKLYFHLLLFCSLIILFVMYFILYFIAVLFLVCMVSAEWTSRSAYSYVMSRFWALGTGQDLPLCYIKVMILLFPCLFYILTCFVFRFWRNFLGGSQSRLHSKKVIIRSFPSELLNHFSF